MHGGSGAIWSRLRERLPADAVMSGTRVVEVDHTARTVALSNGRQISYGHLISSIPLDQFLGLLKHNPLPELASRFRLANAAFVGLGLRGEPPPGLVGVHSFHMPEQDIPCWRVNFPKSLSPHNVPAGRYWSILCEISHSSGSDFDIQQAEVVIVRKLQERGIIPADNQIVSRWHAHMQHGYPIPFLGRDAVLSQAQHALQAQGIFSRGRFGGWKYEVSNQDHSFMQGMETIGLICDGTREATYRLEPA
jgi:protoporphyrinogen oxidase